MQANAVGLKGEQIEEHQQQEPEEQEDGDDKPGQSRIILLTLKA
jgi:hypothetical protein